MKKYFFLALLFYVFNNLTVVASFNADSAFISANNEYINENYHEAIDRYEAILGQGFESSELYYNLGNAYYKLSDYPRSILNYEKALLLDPHNENIKFNLEKAQIYIVDQVDEIPEVIVRRWLLGAIAWLNSNTWALLSVIFFLICLTGFLLYFLIAKISFRRTGFYTGVLFLILSAFTFIMAYKSKSMLTNSNGAIIMTPTVTVKGSPSNTSTDLFIVHEGTKVFVLDELNDWYEIKLSDGKRGWLLKSDIEPI